MEPTLAEYTGHPPADATGGNGHDDMMIQIGAGRAHATAGTLLLFERFFRHHASAAVHAELRAFCAAQGWHPVSGAETLLDQLALDAWPLQRALAAAQTADGSETHGTTTKSTTDPETGETAKES